MSKISILFAAALALSGCATQPAAGDAPIADVGACINSLDGGAADAANALQTDGFSVVNWNIQKGRNAGWANDLQQMHSAADLLIVQEASPTLDAWDELAPTHFRSFAEGFGIRRSVTGALTLSSAEPLTECSLVALEPWFGTRKATLVTEYALSDSDETLLVLNIHSVNFSFGVRHMREQLEEAATVIAAHEGPVLFSGDFNTWRGRRAEVVEEIAGELGLTALEYDDDHRKRMFGWALDHIYVRGLYAEHATSTELESSDHNPMLVRLTFVEPPAGARAAP
jgi:endonuclease/exonuclease/phosphatase (EEP) superfamily protein YafD